MSFLRRLLGGSSPTGSDATESADPRATPAGATPAGPAADDEVERDRELLREEARRLDDDLIQRQLRYADHAWTPPPQGGTRRAEDEDASAE